jgi:hypothetical protein
MVRESTIHLDCLVQAVESSNVRGKGFGEGFVEGLLASVEGLLAALELLGPQRLAMV